MLKPLFLLLALVAGAPCLASEGTNTGPGRAVLVTGASSGIGKRIAMTLAEEGFFVYAGARRAEDIDRLSALANIQGIRLDVTRQDEIDAAVNTVRKAGRGLHGLVNNAGVFLFDPMIEVSEDDMQFIFDVNVFGPYRVTRAFAPLIIESRGRITTIGSIASARSAPLFGPYSMTKAAMTSFTEALSGEMSKFDVAVSIVDPGNFRSDIMKNTRHRGARSPREGRPSRYEAEIGRMAGFTRPDRSQHAEPKPVADAVLHFLSSAEPRLRYMVTPSQREASFTLRNTLQRAVELNRDQRFSLNRDQLVAMLDQLLSNQNAE